MLEGHSRWRPFVVFVTLHITLIPNPWTCGTSNHETFKDTNVQIASRVYLES
ncbi:hypothetical protein BDV36DRAFT_223502 [Aspergillus pseudocaelatus]|uniref:Uncharacterized protein n=1 Tax=Aspergillus pseudocaelatus TaxID=1825620 RepID=A0ABQ6WZP9_9EURO|nr:hypothetical protein BDV36DRAFT_223502 [Aspergillus pseudocaelatus]